MKTFILFLLASFLMVSCKKETFVCSCTYYNGFSPNTTSESTIHDTERKAKKQCDANNPKSNGGYIGASHHCQLK